MLLFVKFNQLEGPNLVDNDGGNWSMKRKKSTKSVLKSSIWDGDEEAAPWRRPERQCESSPLSTNRNYCYGNSHTLSSSVTISIVYTYMHALVSCRPGPDGGEVHNSLICLGPLKECSKTSPIPSGCHQNAQRQRHTICSRHHGQTPFLSVLNFNSPTPFF